MSSRSKGPPAAYLGVANLSNSSRYVAEVAPRFNEVRTAISPNAHRSSHSFPTRAIPLFDQLSLQARPRNERLVWMSYRHLVAEEEIRGRLSDVACETDHNGRWRWPWSPSGSSVTPVDTSPPTRISFERASNAACNCFATHLRPEGSLGDRQNWAERPLLRDQGHGAADGVPPCHRIDGRRDLFEVDDAPNDRPNLFRKHEREDFLHDL